MLDLCSFRILRFHRRERAVAFLSSPCPGSSSWSPSTSSSSRATGRCRPESACSRWRRLSRSRRSSARSSPSRYGTKLVVASGLLSDGLLLPVGHEHVGDNRLRHDCGPDGRAWNRHGPDERTRYRGDHGRRAEGEGRRRIRDQRRHPPARRHARGRGDRQRVRLAVRHPHRRAPCPAGCQPRSSGPRTPRWARH